MNELDHKAKVYLLEFRNICRKNKLEHRDIAKEWARKEREIDELIEDHGIEKEVEEENKLFDMYETKSMEQLAKELELDPPEMKQMRAVLVQNGTK